MLIRVAALALGVLLLPGLTGKAAASPVITIKLAPEIRSENVTIYYVLYGVFGAYGADVTAQPNVHSYRIRPVHEGKLAASIKGVIYASGCESDTFEADISGNTSIEESYDCVALPTVSLVGHIANNRLYRYRNLEVVVQYMADWECRFFEFADCPVPQIQLARAPVNENGEFEANIVDFSPEQAPTKDREAELLVMLRDAKTWNLVGQELRPSKDLRARSGGLAIRPFYPPPVEFEVVFTPGSVPAPPNARR